MQSDIILELERRPEINSHITLPMKPRRRRGSSKLTASKPSGWDLLRSVVKKEKGNVSTPKTNVSTPRPRQRKKSQPPINLSSIPPKPAALPQFKATRHPVIPAPPTRLPSSFSLDDLASDDHTTVDSMESLRAQLNSATSLISVLSADVLTEHTNPDKSSNSKHQTSQNQELTVINNQLRKELFQISTERDALEETTEALEAALRNNKKTQENDNQYNQIQKNNTIKLEQQIKAMTTSHQEALQNQNIEHEKSMQEIQSSLANALNNELTLTKEVTKEVTQQVTQDVTEKITQEITQRVTEQVTQQVTQQVTAQVTKEVTEEVSLQVEIDVTEQISLEITDELTKSITKRKNIEFDMVKKSMSEDIQTACKKNLRLIEKNAEIKEALQKANASSKTHQETEKKAESAWFLEAERLQAEVNTMRGANEVQQEALLKSSKEIHQLKMSATEEIKSLKATHVKEMNRKLFVQKKEHDADVQKLKTKIEISKKALVESQTNSIELQKMHDKDLQMHAKDLQMHDQDLQQHNHDNQKKRAMAMEYDADVQKLTTKIEISTKALIESQTKTIELKNMHDKDLQQHNHDKFEFDDLCVQQSLKNAHIQEINDGPEAADSVEHRQ